MQRMNRIRVAVVAIAVTCVGSEAHAGIENVRLLQRPIEDAPAPLPAWIEGAFRYQDLGDDVTATVLGLRSSSTIARNLELGASVGYASIDVDGGDGADGIFDPEIFVRYLFDPFETASGSRTQLALGGSISLPIGDEDLVQETLDFEVFGALRYYMDDLCWMGSLAIRVNDDPEITVDGETFTIPAETSFFVGGALLASLTDAITFVGELDVETERLEGADSDVRLTPGLDAMVGERAHLRGGIGLGLTDGAPDVEAIVSLAIDL